MGKKLIIFGVSGVLLGDKIGGIKDLLVILGKEKEVRKIDKEYQKRKFTGPWGLKKIAELYRGFSESELKEAAFKYCQANLREEAREVLSELKKKGHLLGALSANPQFIMKALLEILPLDFSEGTRLEFKKGIATGKIQKKVDRYIKAKILKQKIKTLGFKKEKTLVIGDSVTDLPMAKEAGLFIGFDPKEETVREVANAIIEQKDLRKIFKL